MWSSYPLWGDSSRVAIPGVDSNTISMPIGVSKFMGTQAEAEVSMQLWIDRFGNNALYNFPTIQYTECSSFLEWARPGVTDTVGFGVTTNGRLVTLENFATEEARSATASAIASTFIGTFIVAGGGQVLRSDRNSVNTSVTPAWRNTLLQYSGGSLVPVT